MISVLLIGCGGHARSLIDLIESGVDTQIYGLVGLPEQVGSTVLEYPVIGCDDDLPALREKCPYAILAIGQLADPFPRIRLAAHLKTLGFQFPILSSPSSIISRYAQLGPGTTVGHGAVINAGAVVGDHCIVNSCALIEHDVHIGHHCHISTGVLVNGGVSVGFGSFIGSGVIVREGIDFPPLTIVGAGKRVMGWPLKD